MTIERYNVTTAYLNGCIRKYIDTRLFELVPIINLI